MDSPNDYIGALIADSDDAVHYGVKGMRWGVKNDLKRMAPGDRAAYIKGRDAKWTAKVQANPKLGKIGAKAARDAKRQTKALKKEFKEQGVNLKKDRLARTRYDAELKNILEQSLDRAAYKVHKFPPTRLNEVKITRNADGTLSASIVPRSNRKITKQSAKINASDQRKGLSHADLVEDREDDFVDFSFTLITDEEGYVDDINIPGGMEHSDDVPDYLGSITESEDDAVHYGVKGMQWGVRRDRATLKKAAATRGTAKKAAPKPVAKKAAPSAPAAPAKKPASQIQDHVESSADRYTRLAAAAKAGRASDMTEQDLKFFNARTEALNKVNKMYEEKPGWLAETSKNVLQSAAQKQMQNVADTLANKYIGAPITGAIQGKKKD